VQKSWIHHSHQTAALTAGAERAEPVSPSLRPTEEKMVMVDG